MIILLMLPFLFSNFVQKWYIPQGTNGPAGRILIADADRDGNYEFYIRTYGESQKVYIYELHLPNIWEVDSFSYLYSPLLWDTGDFDLDGLWDLAIQVSATQSYPTMVISIAESPDSFSYPTQEVWRDTVGFALVQPISVYDVDQDSFPEIFKLGWRKEDSITTYYPFGIYESVGDNQYDTIFMGTGLGSLSSTMAFGDFDADTYNEFVIGNINGWYQLWECDGNNSYQLLEQQQLSTVNIKDCFSIADADGDGKLEFVIKGFVVPTERIHAFIFEAISDNAYEIVKSFDLFGGSNDYYGGYSDAGDVDGDSIPEIVLEGCQNIYIIKSAGNDSFYVWDTLPGHASGSNVRIYDIDGNGLSEIIISGNNETRIYEYDPGGMEETALRPMPDALRLEVSPNPFSKLIKISFGKGHSAEGIALKIYDVSGRMIKSFDPEGIRTEGQFNYPTLRLSDQITWKGDDENGRTVSQGVYFLQVENLTSGNAFCRKIIKIK